MSERNKMLISMLILCTIGAVIYEHVAHLGGMILMLGSVLIALLNLFADI